MSQLAERGWEVTVAATDRAEHVWVSRFAAVTPDVFVLPVLFGGRHDAPLTPFDAPRFLRHLAMSRDVDAIIISNSLLALAMLPWFRAERPQTATAVIVHSHLHPLAVAHLSAPATLILSSNEDARTELTAQGVDPRRIESSTTNVDETRWRPDADVRARVRADLGVPSETPIVLYAARFTPDKQPDVFAATVADLARRGVDFVALVAGAGEAPPWFEEFIAAHGLGCRRSSRHVQPSGWLPDLMAAADVCFLPSQREGIAMVAYECMAAGGVFVGADVGGQHELVTPDCGILLPRGDRAGEARAYADALEELLRSPGRLAAMGRAARERTLASFTLDAMGARIEALLARAAELNREAPPPAFDRDVCAALATLATQSIRAEGHARGPRGAPHRPRPRAARPRGTGGGVRRPGRRRRAGRWCRRRPSGRGGRVTRAGRGVG